MGNRESVIGNRESVIGTGDWGLGNRHLPKIRSKAR